jgi:hypothetical protein
VECVGFDNIRWAANCSNKNRVHTPAADAEGSGYKLETKTTVVVPILVSGRILSDSTAAATAAAAVVVVQSMVVVVVVVVVVLVVI